MKNKHLQNNRLSSYAALAGALLTVQQADAQVIYTDVDPDLVVESSDLFGFDLDNDGTDDFGLINVLYSAIGAMNVVLYGSGGVAGYIGSFLGSTFPFVSVIDAGEAVGPSLDFYSTSGGAPLLWGSFAVVGSLGQFNNVSDKYIGLRFKIGSDFHYGWARLDVTHTTITLKDYAYNGTANAPINTTVGIESPDTNFNPAIYAIDGGVHVALPNNVENAAVSIFDLSGRMIHSAFIYNEADILLNDLSKGMYLVKVQDNEQYYSRVVSLN